MQIQPIEQPPVVRYAAIMKQRMELEEMVANLKKEAAKLEEVILDQWADTGEKSVKIGGVGTVFLADEFTCYKRKEFTAEAVCLRLKAEGLGGYVAEGYAPASIKAWVKEQLANEGEVPESLQECFDYETKSKLRMRRT
jgi:hypothetical protein